MSSPTILLRIDALGLDAFQIDKNSINRIATFTHGERSQFADWLQAQAPRARYRLLVDLSDESFEVETLPRVRGTDRRALIARRLAQSFTDPAYAKAESLGVDRQAGTEKLLFNGLTRPSRLQAWMSALHDSGRAIELMTSPGRLLAHFLPGTSSRLAVSFSRAGMRLTLIEAGQARLSRLLESITAETVLDGVDWQTELDRTLHYARAHGADVGDEKLRVVIVAPATVLTTHASAASTHIPAAEYFDPNAHASPDASASATDSTALLLSWLKRAPPKLGWPGPHPQHAAKLRQLAPFALGCGVLALLAGLGLSTLYWRATAAAEQARITLQREITQLQREHAALQAEEAALDAKPAQMIDIVHRIALERSAAIDPQALLSRLANSLEHTPTLQLHTLTWAPALTTEAGSSIAQVDMTVSAAPPAQLMPTAKSLTAHLEAQGARQIALQAKTDRSLQITLLLPLETTARPYP